MVCVPSIRAAASFASLTCSREQVYTVAIKAGATTLNIPDTVGFTTPSEFRRLVEYLREHVEGIEGVTISVHGHDDLGMAVANFLSAVEGGARQVEVTINGIGERAGNAAMEEIVMALHVRKAYYNPAFGRPADSEAPLTNIVLKEIYRSSKLVTALTGMAVQANKAIVGANAFAHESGIHQHGMLANPLCYEIMTPESVGASKTNLVLGKHSGRAALRHRIEQLGYTLDREELQHTYYRFVALADRKKNIYDQDLVGILPEQIRERRHVPVSELD